MSVACPWLVSGIVGGDRLSGPLVGPAGGTDETCVTARQRCDLRYWCGRSGCPSNPVTSEVPPTIFLFPVFLELGLGTLDLTVVRPPPGVRGPVLEGGAAVYDPFDVTLEDGDLLGEVEMTTTLIVAASEKDGRLSEEEIDSILGVIPIPRQR